MNNLISVKRRLVKAFAKRKIISILETEEVPCPLCGKSKEFKVLYEVDRYGIPVNVVRCMCGMAFENPMPTDKFLNTFYGTYLFRALDWGVLKVTPKIALEFQAQERAQRRLSLLRNFLPLLLTQQNKTVLDVGASEGTFLKEIKQEFPLVERYAVEPGKNFSHLIDEGVREVWSDISIIPAEKKFDCVTLSHVLEHVRYPKEFVTQIKNHIKPGGYFVVEVPTIDRYNNSIRPIHIDHTLHFSENTLSQLLVQTGFTIENIVSDDTSLMDNKYGIAIVARIL